MILHIYPVADNADQVIGVDDAGYFVRSRDTLFRALDVIRSLYDDVIIHLDPID